MGKKHEDLDGRVARLERQADVFGTGLIQVSQRTLDMLAIMKRMDQKSDDLVDLLGQMIQYMRLTTEYVDLTVEQQEAKQDLAAAEAELQSLTARQPNEGSLASTMTAVGAALAALIKGFNKQ